MLKVYGSEKCIDCVNFKKNLERYGIAYMFVEIFDNLKDMKEFLKLRDQEDVFFSAKENGSIGIPAVVKEDGSITLDWKGVIRELGFEPFQEQKSACSLNDRSGC